MSLAKTIAEIVFNQGLDRKTDEKLVLNGKLTRLENAVFDSGNTVRRRDGYAAMTLTAMTGSSAVSGMKSLMRVRDEVLIEDANGLHACVLDGAQAEKTVSKSPAGVAGTLQRTALSIREIGASAVNQTEYDAAFGAYSSCWVWTELRLYDNRREIHWLTVDETTGAHVAKGVLGYATDDYFRPRVVYNESAAAFEIYYCLTSGGVTDLKHRRILASNLASISSANGAGTTHATATFDVVYDAVNTKLFMVAKGAGAGTALVLSRLSVTDGYTVSATVTTGAYAAEILSVCAHVQAAGGTVYYHSICHVTGVGTISDQVNSGDTLTNVGLVNVATGLTSIGRLCAFASYRYSSGTHFNVIYEDNSASANLALRTNAALAFIDGSGAGTQEILARGVGIAARPFTYDGKSFLPVVLMSAVQPTGFVICLSEHETEEIYGYLAAVVAKILPEEFGNLKGAWNVQHRIPGSGRVYGLDSYKFHIPICRRSKLAYYKTTDVTVSTVADAYLDMLPTNGLGDCESSGLLFMAGAQPRLYDGEQWFEAGYNYFPEITAAGTGAGSMTPSTSIAVTAVYEWIDALGQRHQSAPAVPVTIALTGAQGGIDLTVQTLRLHDKNRPDLSGLPRGVRIVPYRTKSNGTVFYRTQASTRQNEENLPNFDTMTLDLRDADTDLGSGELLYTTGTVLESDAFAACRFCVTHQKRIFTAGHEDPLEVRYTEEHLVVDRIGPSTNTVYTLHVPEGGGPITGLASLDDKLVVFCKTKTFYFVGEGANRLGLSSTFSQPIVASSVFGHVVSEANSIVVTSDGVWFHSLDGLRFLTRGMEVARNQDRTFMGSEVDSYSAGVAVNAGLVSSAKRQARFYLASTVLVYDYQFGQWSLFTNHSNVDAAVDSGGLFRHITASAMRREAVGLYTDAGTAIAMLLETGWLKFAGIQGFERAYRFKALGTYETTSTFKLEVGYDYGTAYQTAVQMTTGSVFTSAVPVQVEHHLPKQKCEAVRFRITDTSTAAGQGTKTLTAMGVQVGIKKGYFKTPSGQRI